MYKAFSSYYLYSFLVQKLSSLSVIQTSQSKTTLYCTMESISPCSTALSANTKERPPSRLCQSIPFLGTSEHKNQLGVAFHETIVHLPFCFSLCAGSFMRSFLKSMLKILRLSQNEQAFFFFFPRKTIINLAMAQIRMVWQKKKCLAYIFPLTLFNSPYIKKICLRFYWDAPSELCPPPQISMVISG